MDRVARLAPSGRPTHSPRRQHTGETTVHITSLLAGSPRPWARPATAADDYIAFEDSASDEGESDGSDDAVDGKESHVAGASSAFARC